MIGSTRRVGVWAYTSPTDMRKGYDGLSALVERELGRDPLSGEMFLFVSRDRKRAKVLLWDGTGLCLYAKRLEEGLFANLWRAEASTLRLTVNELQLFLEGSTLVGRVSLSPKEFERKRIVNAPALCIRSANPGRRRGADLNGPDLSQAEVDQAASWAMGKAVGWGVGV